MLFWIACIPLGYIIMSIINWCIYGDDCIDPS